MYPPSASTSMLLRSALFRSCARKLKFAAAIQIPSLISPSSTKWHSKLHEFFIHLSYSMQLSLLLNVVLLFFFDQHPAAAGTASVSCGLIFALHQSASVIEHPIHGLSPVWPVQTLDEPRPTVTSTAIRPISHLPHKDLLILYWVEHLRTSPQMLHSVPSQAFPYLCRTCVHFAVLRWLLSSCIRIQQFSLGRYASLDAASNLDENHFELLVDRSFRSACDVHSAARIIAPTS